MKWLTLVAALVISGCVTSGTPNTETSSTPEFTTPDMQTTEEASKTGLPAFVPSRFICKTRESIIGFVNIDMHKKGRTTEQQNQQFKEFGLHGGECIILPMALNFVPTERILNYTDQMGYKSSAFKVVFGESYGYVATIDRAQNMGLPI